MADRVESRRNLLGRFVHVDPERIDIDARVGTEEAGEFRVPVALGIGVEPIRESSDTWPHNTLIDRAIVKLQEDVLITAVVEAWVVLVRDSWINHHDVVLLMLVQEIDQFTDFR